MYSEKINLKDGVNIPRMVDFRNTKNSDLIDVNQFDKKYIALDISKVDIELHLQIFLPGTTINR